MTKQVVTQWIRAQFKVRWLRVIDQTVLWTARSLLFIASLAIVMMCSAQLYAMGFNETVFEPYTPGVMGVLYALSILGTWIVFEGFMWWIGREDTGAAKAKAERERLKHLSKQAQGDELKLVKLYHTSRKITLFVLVAWTVLMAILFCLVLLSGDLFDMLTLLLAMCITLAPILVATYFNLSLRSHLIERLEKRLGAMPA